MLNHSNKGYIKNRMSIRASLAYAKGEMPLSKWTRSELIERITEINEETARLCSNLTAKELKDNFLRLSSYHHTGMYYNKTDFYELDEDYINSFSEKDLKYVLERREEKKQKAKAERDAKTPEQKEFEKEQKEYKKAYSRYERACKKAGQYSGRDISGKPVKAPDKERTEKDCTIDDIARYAELLENLVSEYEHQKNCKYATVRGYVNNRLKNISNGL